MNYRIVRSSGHFPFHVIDSNGLPHKELTLYACTATQFHSFNTGRAYTREVVMYASWASNNPIVVRQGWTLLGSPDEIRAMLSFFLTKEMKCIIAIGKDRLGFETRRIEPTWATKRSLERLFAALRSFYEALRLKGLYPHPNPMEGNGAREIIEEERQRITASFVKANERGPMPANSGVDQFKLARTSAAYFRLRGDQWLPTIVDDPSIFNTVLTAGEKWGWALREIGLVRVLFDTGCRIHEACALTMADWFCSKFQKELRAISKGSHGRRVKRLFITDRTVKVLQRYVDEQRVELDPQKRTLSAFATLPLTELEKIPLFLTRQETALTPDHFRRVFWTPALECGGLKVRLHQIRHWFVTMALNDIHQRARSDEQLQNLRSELRELMAWKSDMLPTYDQAIRRYNLPELASKIHLRVEEEHQSAVTKIRTQQSTNEERRKSESQQLLEEMLGL